jgi:hypothetical protein
MVSAINNALSGLLNATKKLDGAARNIAAPDINPTLSKPDIIQDIVDIKTSEFAYKANIAVLKTAQDMEDSLLESFDKRV